METFGRLHPLILHLPIGILFIVILFQIAAFFKPFKSLSQQQFWMLLVATVTAFGSCYAGDLLASEGGYPIELLEKHESAGWVTAYLCLVATIVAYLKQRSNRGYLQMLYYVLLASFIPALWFTGHYGGSLTHGEGFLNEVIPSFGGNNSYVSVEVPEVHLKSLQESQVYNQVIYPIIIQKCESCHNPTKAKGGFMVHTPDALLKGGANGLAIVPGSAAQSLMIQRILLPLEHKQHMSPKGTTQITADELQTLQWWVNKGAPFEGTFAALDLSEQEQLQLEKWLHIEKQEASLFDTITIASAAPTLLTPIEKAGMKVIPIKQGSNFLAVYSNGLQKLLTDKEIALLEPIAQNIVWLDVKRTAITDASLPVILKMTNLLELNIQHTKISKRGLEQLRNLKNLQKLNSYGV